MSLLIYADQKNSIILRPIVMKMCPEFSALDEKELMVIILSYDYHSIYKQHNERARIAYAITRVYGNNEPKLLKALEEKTPNHRITNAVNAYKSLQYDPKIELIHTYQKTIDDTQMQISSELTERELDTKLKNISRLRKSILELELEITDGLVQQGQVKGDQTLSYLEQLQKNKQLYEAITRKKQK